MAKQTAEGGIDGSGASRRVARLSYVGVSLDFPTSLPGFQQLFPDDAVCAAYLEDTRWPDGFTRTQMALCKSD